jgi:CRP/FNR family cyclic AMP-dependent transcriptional regulator
MLTRSFPKDSIVLYEQDDSQSLYVVNKGRLKVTRCHEDGKEVVISMLAAGDYFGEIALIDGGPRSTNVISTKECELFMFQRRDILHLFTLNPQLMLNFMMGLTKRIRIASKKIESLALRNVYGRVTELLLDLAKPNHDQLVIDDPLTHRDIALMVGSSREMVSRILKDLITGNYISIKRRRITINKTLPLEW